MGVTEHMSTVSLFSTVKLYPLSFVAYTYTARALQYNLVRTRYQGEVINAEFKMPCAFIDKRMLEYSTERAYCTSVALKDHPHLHQWQPVKQSAPGGAKCEYYRFRIARLFSLTNAGSQGFWATGDYRQTACHCNEGFFIFNRSFDKARLVTTNQESVEWFLRHSGDFEYEGPWKLGSAGTPYNELITL